VNKARKELSGKKRFSNSRRFSPAQQCRNSSIDSSISMDCRRINDEESLSVNREE
jgi:hypothetical protein